jgi:exopolyphosphatase/guanosine-5'-triphosphate,3'-diphosphate pyrophosphatase
MSARHGEPVFAALDLGTNNCRLLLAQENNQRDNQTANGDHPGRDETFRVVDSFSRIVRLGEGVEASGALSEAAMARTIGALVVCADKIRRAGVAGSRCVATQACRQAANGGDFVERVRGETGLELEIISPQEEAHLTVEGCLPLFHQETSHALLFDIGGGSTELIWLRLDGDAPQNINNMNVEAVSLPFGVVSLSERFIPENNKDGAWHDYEDIVAHAQGLLTPFEEAHGISALAANGKVQVVGTSGTMTTVAAVCLDLPRYDRRKVDGTYLSLEEISAVSRRLVAMDDAARIAQPCIGALRSDLVVYGCAILEAICRLWPVQRLRVADRGLREGILLGLMNDAADQAAGTQAAGPGT